MLFPPPLSVARAATAVFLAATALTLTPLPASASVSPGSYDYWQLPIAPYGSYQEIEGYIDAHNVPQANTGQAPPTYFYAFQFADSGDANNGYVGLTVDSSGQHAHFSWC